MRRTLAAVLQPQVKSGKSTASQPESRPVSPSPPADSLSQAESSLVRGRDGSGRGGRG